MAIGAFPKLQRLQASATPIRDVTLKDFSGGLRLVDNELVLNPKYSATLTNIVDLEEYSLTARFGTKLFATFSADVLNGTYFNGAIIAFLVDGTIEKAAADGTVTAIWNSTIAYALPGHPSGWSATQTMIDFVEVAGELIVVNGKDKPLLISAVHAVTYLQDKATGSNINTPIAEFAAQANDYVVMANIVSGATINRLKLLISNKSTSGTWLGDAAPNDATSFELKAYVSEQSDRIVGLGTFKQYLLVYFPKALIIVQLGVYDTSGTHTPQVVDVIADTGILGYRSQAETAKDIVFLSPQGVLSAKQAMLSEKFEISTLSDNIAPELNSILPQVYSSSVTSFVLQDTVKKRLFFFIRTSDGALHCYVGGYSSSISRIRWSKITGWDFTWGCRSHQNRIFFGEANKLYQYGNDLYEDEAYTADYISSTEPEGVPIAVDWETPWMDLGNRTKTKTLLRILADTQGEASFSVQVFVDKIRYTPTQEDDPALAMEMLAGTAEAFGQPNTVFGGGRNISGEQQFGFPVRGKLFKIRIAGEIDAGLQLASLSLIYSLGHYHR